MDFKKAQKLFSGSTSPITEWSWSAVAVTPLLENKMTLKK
jgi:hypothetical protein